MNDSKQELDAIVQSLHPVIKSAIQSSKINIFLQSLVKKYKIPLDKFNGLEAAVLMVLVGALRSEDVVQTFVSDIGIEKSIADTLASDLNVGIFAPIREEIERQLDHPDAKEKVGTPIEDMTSEILKTVSENSAPTTAQTQQDALITTDTTSYHAGTPSTARKDVHNDPYREQPL